MLDELLEVLGVLGDSSRFTTTLRLLLCIAANNRPTRLAGNSSIKAFRDSSGNGGATVLMAERRSVTSCTSSTT